MKARWRKRGTGLVWMFLLLWSVACQKVELPTEEPEGTEQPNGGNGSQTTPGADENPLPEEVDRQAIAIVGSRRATVYGLRMAQHIAESAAYSGWAVVSGLAFGIDAAAHKATMNAGGKTVAVLGGGLMKIQPQEHLPMARDIIAKGGAVITEFPMTFPPTRHSFPMRNHEEPHHFRPFPGDHRD